MLRTRLSQVFDLRYPILSAPMANHSGGRLAAAVSSAGGLGTFGGINPGGADWIREQVGLVRSATDAAFAVGFITTFMAPGLLDACVELHVPNVIFSFGDPSEGVRRCQKEGIRVLSQVQTLEGVRQALDLGVDAIIVQGNEAGGHSGYMMTLPLVAMAADIVSGTPLIAAGGIGNGRALAAVMAAGADGAMLGTAFLATPECVEVPEHYKQLIVDSDGQDTVHSQVYDIMGGAPWPEGIGGRSRVNAFTREWEGRERELRGKRDEVLPRLRDGQQRRDPEVESVWMGQAAGMVPSIRPSADVIRAICDDAERILRERPGQLLG